MTRTILATLAAAAWISISEFFRNSILFHALWEDHYKSLGLSFPNAPANGMIWGLWSLAYAGCILAISRRFSLLETIALAWVFGFVMMWLVIGNLGVMPPTLLIYAIPLSILEAGVASVLAMALAPPSK
jgi:hypothetical protein